MGKLFVVATPIGNLEDLTFRAKRVLEEADFIACEDTRRTKILLDKYSIKKPLISFHQHSKLQKVDYLIELLKQGKSVALVCDAGTPGISDPGGVLVGEAIKNNIKIEPIPGPSSFAAILSIAGFYLDKFLYLGFLPKKKGRKKLIENLKLIIENFGPIVLLESPYRIKKTLEELKETLGDEEVVIGRELTKKFETVYRGKISEVIKEIKPKGEFTVVVSGFCSPSGSKTRYLSSLAQPHKDDHF